MKTQDVDDLIADYKTKLEAHKFQIKELEKKILEAEAYKNRLQKKG